jgi:hypothetical protein
MGGYAPRPLPRSRLRKLPSAPLRRRTSLLEHCNGPMVAGWRGRPSVPDRTPCAAPRIDHQLGTGAELPPLSGDVRRSSVWTQQPWRLRRAIMMDIDQAAKAMRDEEMLAEIEDFTEGFNQPTWRGMRVNGERVPVWSSQRGMSGL